MTILSFLLRHLATSLDQCSDILPLTLLGLTLFHKFLVFIPNQLKGIRIRIQTAHAKVKAWRDWKSKKHRAQAMPATIHQHFIQNLEAIGRTVIRPANAKRKVPLRSFDRRRSSRFCASFRGNPGLSVTHWLPTTMRSNTISSIERNRCTLRRFPLKPLLYENCQPTGPFASTVYTHSPT